MNGLLVITLQIAVPLWIHEVARLTEAERLAEARECSRMTAEHGDNILYLSQRQGETAEAFNALARGLACAAYQPGGVWFHGTHFCTDHSVCAAAEVARQ